MRVRIPPELLAPGRDATPPKWWVHRVRYARSMPMDRGVRVYDHTRTSAVQETMSTSGSVPNARSVLTGRSVVAAAMATAVATTVRLSGGIST